MKDNQRRSLQQIVDHVKTIVDLPITIELWDGTSETLGSKAGELTISVQNKATIASLLKKPSLENVLRHYAVGNVDFKDSDFMTFGEVLREKLQKEQLKKLNKKLVIKNLLPFLWVKSQAPQLKHRYEKDESGVNRKTGDNQDYIQFHYDVSNDFYKLFLDPEMQYSCAYFTDWNNTLEQAQQDKLEMICRKLRLKKGESFLDIGCGWGGLLCYAAKHYGVKAHGITLSQAQYERAQEKIKEMGLEGQVTVEIRDYITLEGCYDKIASIGMFEHIGIANFPDYFKKIHSLLRDRGIFLNHAITRRAKRKKKKMRKLTPVNRLIQKYIFPGSELAPIGQTIFCQEAHGFEIHDVEGWREHYALTCKLWYKRLAANKETAIKMVGEERYRLWAAYLAGVSFGFLNDSSHIYQTVATKRGKKKGASGMPPTRADLYTRRDSFCRK